MVTLPAVQNTEDEFINNQVFSWMTRSRVSADSIESRKLIASSDSGLKILLFVKKSDGEGTDFYIWDVFILLHGNKKKYIMIRVLLFQL